MLLLSFCSPHKVKWRNYGSYVFWLNFAIYTVFMVLLTAFVLEKRRNTQLDRPGEETNPVEQTTNNFGEVIPYVAFVFAALNILKELYQMVSQRLAYFTQPSNWLELGLYLTAILFVSPLVEAFELTYLQGKPEVYWQLGTWSIFLGYVNFVLYTQTLSYVGLYVTMFLEVSKTMLKASCLFIMFGLGFSVVFYVLFREQVSDVFVYFFVVVALKNSQLVFATAQGQDGWQVSSAASPEILHHTVETTASFR